jgi:hypothetical protein
MSRRAWFAGSGLLLLAGGLSITNSVIIGERAKRVPVMTCDRLVTQGPGPEGYVTLSDVRLCSRGYVFRRDSISPGDMELYIPVYASRWESEPEPRDLFFVLEIRDDDDRERILEQQRAVEFTCQVHRGSGRLEPWVQESLAAKYPGMRLADVSVLTVGLHEPTARRARSAATYGILELLAGGAILARLNWRKKSTSSRTPLHTDSSRDRSA